MSNKSRQSYNVREVEKAMRIKEQIERYSISQIPASERMFGKELNNAGRKAYFDEYFNGVKVENQEISPIGPFVDPRTTVSFKNGYQRGDFLVKSGIIPEEYQNIANNNRAR